MFHRNLFPKLTLASLLLCSVSIAQASDHADAPLLDRNLRISDLYAFQSPTNSDNTVLILAVNPSASLANGTTFSSEGRYEFLIDNDADAEPDVTYSVSFTATTPQGTQTLQVFRNNSAYGSGRTERNISITGGSTLRAGLFDDPFFFDPSALDGSPNGFGDAFRGRDVSAIVLEVPSSELGGPDIGVWARTLIGGSQQDRVGRPATSLILSLSSNSFNQGDPVNDLANFGNAARARVRSRNGGNVALATEVADMLLPDLITLDTSSSSSEGFLNGRRLADNALDDTLSLVFNRPIDDGVDENDVPFRNVFPYLAPAHVPFIIPEPSGIVLAVLGLSAAMFRRRRRSQV